MTPRKYHSELREAQTGATRDKILDALVEVLASGVDNLSVPAVAGRAGVSVGTVYRHFGDKSGLLEALVPYAGRRSGIAIDSLPETVEDFDDVVRRVFRHFEATDDLLRAALASSIGRDVRMRSTPERFEAMREPFRTVEPNLQPDQMDHIAKAALILTASDTYQQWKDRFGMGPDEAADEVMWVIRTLLRGAVT